MFNYLLKLLFNQAIFYLLPTLFGLDSRMTPVSFCFVGYITIIHLLFRGLRSLLVLFLRSCSKLPFVRSPNIPLYLYFGRLIVNTIVLDRNDFIEETCILRCHFNSHPKRFSGFRRSFVVCGCCAAAGGTLRPLSQGDCPRCFLISMVVSFYFRFVESTEVDFCLCCFGCCFRYIFCSAVLTCNLFQIQFFHSRVMYRIS